MSTLTWKRDKELEREIKTTKETNFVGRKTWKFYSSGEKMRNSGVYIRSEKKKKKKGGTETLILISAGKQRVAKCGIIVYFQISYWRKKFIYSYYNVPIFIVFYLLYLLMSS